MSSISAPVLIGVLASSGTFGGFLSAGARAAAEAANQAGGIAGRPVAVRELADADPWKSGAGRIARLLDEPGLAALVGPQDGSAAHVAVQVATRRRIPIIALSPEASLTEAGDPWVFRGVPDDACQARALLLRAQVRGRRALLVVPQGREGRQRQSALEQACRDSDVAVAGVIRFESGPAAMPGDCAVLLLWLDPPAARRWFAGPGRRWRPPQMLASLRLDDPQFLDSPPAAAEGLVLPLLRGDAPAPRDVLEGAAYDAVAAIVSAARRGGVRSAAVRAGLAEGGPWRGRSGVFRFDPKGNRLGGFAVGVLRRGRLVGLQR